MEADGTAHRDDTIALPSLLGAEAPVVLAKQFLLAL